MASATMSLHHVLGYSGGELCAVNEDCIAYACGNIVAFISSVSGKQEFLMGKDHGGVTALAFNWKTKMFAFATHSINPEIHLYNVADKFEPKPSLTGGATLKYATLSFSRDGTRLMGIGELTDFKIHIWDVPSGKKLTGFEAKLPAACTFGSFNPANVNEFCTGGENGIYFWSLQKSMEEHIITMRTGAMNPELDGSAGAEGLAEDDDDETAEGEGESPKERFTCHCWTSDGKVLAANMSGDLLLFDVSSRTAEVNLDDEAILRYEKTFHLDSQAQTMILLKDHLLYGGIDRCVRWCTYPEFELKQIATLPPNTMSSITHITPSPFYEKCIVGTDFGSLHEIKLDVDDLGDQVNDQSSRLLQVASHHSGAILGQCVVKTPAGFVLGTVGEDGSVRLWNLGNNSLLKTKRFDALGGGMESLPTAITVCDSHEALPLMAIGSAQGAMRVMFVDRTTNSAELTQLQVFKLFDCPVTELKFHPTEPLIAVASLERGEVYVVSADPESDVVVVAHSKLPKKELVRAFAWKDMQLLVTSDEKKLYGLSVEGKNMAPAGLKETPLTKMHTWDNPSTCMALVKVTSDILITGNIESSEIGCYTTEDAGSIIAAKCMVAAHEKGTVCIQPAPKMETPEHAALCTGGADGSVILWLIRQDQDGINLTQQKKLVVHNGPVVSVSFSQDSRTLYSCGLDGATFSFNLKIPGCGKPSMSQAHQTFAEFRALAAAAKSTGQMDDEVKETTWFEDLKNEVEKIEAVEHESFKTRTRAGADSIIGRLQTLLETNLSVPDLERMERKEFVIDRKSEAESLKMNEKRVQSTREKIENNITEIEVHAERIKKECWDSMETHGREMHALKSGVVVQNYPLRKWSSAQNRKFEKIQLLRQLEINEIKATQGTNSKNCWNGTTEEVPDDIGWIINTGQLQLTGELDSLTIEDVDAKKKKSKNEGKQDAAKGNEANANGKDDDDDDDDDPDKEADEGKEGDAADDGKQLTISAMLYPPMALRTSKQKRTQVHLLAALVRQMQTKFNAKFQDLFALKQDEVDKIEQKNERIKEILQELKIEDSYFTPVWDPAEDPEKVFEVTDAEMTNKVYITEAMRAQMEKEEEERRIREEEAKKDDIGGRALMEMMNGTLEAKKDKDALEQELVREEWMDQLTYEEMDDTQRKELEDFEARVKVLEGEKEKQRKALELELKKLKTDIGDICRVFDDKVKELYDMRLGTQMVIFTEELYMVRLGLSVMEREDEAQVTKELQTQLAEELTKKLNVTDKAVIAKKACEKYREDLNVLLDEDRRAEHKLRAELKEANGAPLDQDTLKILMQLYKLRKSASDSSTRQSGSKMRRSSMSISRRSSISKRKSWQVVRGSVSRRGSSGTFGGANRDSSQLGAGSMMQAAMQEAVMESERTSSQMDPFKTIDEKTQKTKDRERIDIVVPLDIDTDCPEGFILDNEDVWRKLQELRLAKIASEKEIKKRTILFTELKRQAEVLETADNNSAQKIKELQMEIEAVKKRREFESSNLETLIRMKQGQDEVPQEAVVTDYGDAVLVRRTVVEEKNAGIEKLGKDKVNTLGKIKHFRKNINFMIWDHKYLETVAADLDWHHKDLQLLRVTKSLQTFIKGGDSADQQKIDLEKAEAQLEYMRKAHAAKVSKVKTTNQKFMRQVKEKQDENARLKEQMNELRANVDVRENIRRSRHEGHGAEADPAIRAKSRMKTIVMRRKLIDLARAQTDEIEFLRQELDRLRQRTFPSFAHSAKVQQGNPDNQGLF